MRNEEDLTLSESEEDDVNQGEKEEENSEEEEEEEQVRPGGYKHHFAMVSTHGVGWGVGGLGDRDKLTLNTLNDQ